MAIRGIEDLSNPAGVRQTFHIFVNGTTGTDSGVNAQGTALKPYATLQRALQDIPLPFVLRDTTINGFTKGIFFIHLLGTDLTYTLPENYIFPNKVCEDFDIEFVSAGVDTTNLPGLNYMCPINIVGHPLLTNTILNANITAQTPLANSDQIILDTNVAGINTANALRGRLVVGSSNDPACVSHNEGVDATLIPTTGIVAFDQDPNVKVYRPQATVRGFAAETLDSVTFIACGSSVLFYGLNMTGPAGGTGKALAVNKSKVYTFGCAVDGVTVGIAPNIVGQDGSFFEANFCKLTTQALVAAGKANFFNNYFDTATSFAIQGVNADIQTVANYYLAPAGPVWWDSSGVSPAYLDMSNEEIFQAAADGLKYSGPGRLFLEDSNISSSVANGITIEGPCNVTLTSVQSRANNTGVGLRAIGNAQIATESNTTIAGTAADTQIGAQAGESWANIGSGGAPFGMKDINQGTVLTSIVGVPSLANNNTPRHTVITLTGTGLVFTSAQEFIDWDATAGARTGTLPALASMRGKTFTFTKIDSSANTCTINRAGGDTINGGTSVVLSAQFQSVTLLAPDSGTNWIISAVVSGGGAVNSGVPAGAMMAFGGAVAPTGWLLCDGANLLRADFAALFAAIGTAYGTADGTHFNIPDMRGRFPRGTDGAAARDPNSATRTAMNAGGNTGNNVGSVQGFATAEPVIALTSPGGKTVDATGANAFAVNATANDGTAIPVTLGGDAETRPINAYVNYIIRTGL